MSNDNPISDSLYRVMGRAHYEMETPKILNLQQRTHLVAARSRGLPPCSCSRRRPRQPAPHTGGGGGRSAGAGGGPGPAWGGEPDSGRWWTGADCSAALVEACRVGEEASGEWVVTPFLGRAA
jgi:hypothetical protein